MTEDQAEAIIVLLTEIKAHLASIDTVFTNDDIVSAIQELKEVMENKD
jgi:hypothetical protein